MLRLDKPYQYRPPSTSAGGGSHRAHPPAVPCPTVYRLAVERKYDRIPQRLATHPLDAEWQDQNGATALHVMCKLRYFGHHQARLVLQAVQAILACQPALVHRTDHRNCTPLQMACFARNAYKTPAPQNDELIVLLLQARPSAATQLMPHGYSYHRRTCFEVCCETNASLRTLRAFLQVAPGELCDPSKHPKALHLLWNSNAWRHDRKQQAIMIEKMALLLEAYVCGCIGEQEFSILSAVSLVTCPRSFLECLLLHFPDSLLQRDATGRIPLHVALDTCSGANMATNYVLWWTDRLVTTCPAAAGVPWPSSSLSSMPVHKLLSYTHLIWRHPTLYLHILRKLVLAYPAVLWMRDPQSSLVPYLGCAAATATVFGGGKRRPSNDRRRMISMTYWLLQMAPEMVFG